MKKCKLCKSKMPLELYTPLFIGGKYITGLCPICAMATRNKAMGLPLMTPFAGEIASQMVEDAYQYYKPEGERIYDDL